MKKELTKKYVVYNGDTTVSIHNTEDEARLACIDLINKKYNDPKKEYYDRLARLELMECELIMWDEIEMEDNK